MGIPVSRVILTHRFSLDQFRPPEQAGPLQPEPRRNPRGRDAAPRRRARARHLLYRRSRASRHGRDTMTVSFSFSRGGLIVRRVRLRHGPARMGRVVLTRARFTSSAHEPPRYSDSGGPVAAPGRAAVVLRDMHVPDRGNVLRDATEPPCACSCRRRGSRRRPGPSRAGPFPRRRPCPTLAACTSRGRPYPGISTHLPSAALWRTASQTRWVLRALFMSGWNASPPSSPAKKSAKLLVNVCSWPAPRYLLHCLC